MNILICGDSFACDWTVKYPNECGWPNILAQTHNVTNLAQAAVSEYKILQQVKTANLDCFDAIIISHASPNRVHCVEHPIHSNDLLHKSADLIYADIYEHTESPDAMIAARYFERYFDFNFYQDISNLLCMEILNILSNTNLNQFHMVNYQSKDKYHFLDSFNINPIFRKHPGRACHLDNVGNQQIFNHVNRWINSVQT